jgi:hypothetical protein
MKRSLISLLLLVTVVSMSAQNLSDALRYSRLIYGGTARFQGLGGAFGAVGADFSVTATNPAGIGLYKSSELSLSPSLFLNQSSSEYNGINKSDNRANVGMANFGAVFTIPTGTDGKSAFRNFNVAFGVNRQNDFNSKVYMAGVNTNSSLLSSYTNILNSIPGGIDYNQVFDAYPFDIGLAHGTDLIYLYDSINNIYKSDFDDALPGSRAVTQSKSVKSNGSINEFEISFGANLQDKLYFGATIGIPFIRYHEESTYKESWYANSDNYFNSMVYDQELETRGTGVNLKIGMIYRPANWVRLGVAIHTPTYYGNMHDRWNSRMTSNVGYDATGNTSYYEESPLGTYDYQMTTPFRAIGSVAFIVGTYGLVSAEYEYVNYDQARFNEQDDSDGYRDLNDEIKVAFDSPVNLRAGTEWRISDFRVRGGVGYYGSPYNNSGSLGEKILVSGGVGYRGKHLFLDLGYVWSQMKDDYYLYDPALVNASHNTYTDNSVVATVGVRF